MSILRGFLIGLGLLLLATAAQAQNAQDFILDSDSSPTAWIAVPANHNTGAVLTLTAQAAGTVNGADQQNTFFRGVNCTFNQSSHTGTPSTTFAIQVKDSVSAQYVTVVTSGAITADNTPSMLTMSAGAATVANVSDGRPLSRIWRITATVGGTTPVVTATVGCSLIR